MPSTEDTQQGLWARSRQQVYAEITAVAMELFLTNGFEQTTIDEIVAAAGISRRSFFRYFGTKEDVVLGHFIADGAMIRTQLEQRPDDEDPWTALRGALFALEEEADDARLLAVSRMMYQTPSLRARSIEKHLHWYDDLVPEVQRRLETHAGSVLQARVIVGCVITCLDLAGEAWSTDNGVESLRNYFDAALDAIRRPPKAPADPFAMLDQ